MPTSTGTSGSAANRPVSLYKEQWTTLLAMTDEIRAFLAEHAAVLKTKSTPEQPDIWTPHRWVAAGGAGAPWDTFVCWGAPPPWRLIQCRHEPDAIKRQLRDRGNSVAAVETLAADIVDLVKV